MQVRSSAMVEDIGIVATRVHQGIGKYGKTIEGAFLVNGSSKFDDVGSQPMGIDRKRTKGVTKDATEERNLPGLFSYLPLMGRSLLDFHVPSIRSK